MIEATTAEDVIDIVPAHVEIMRDFIVKSVVAIFNFVVSSQYQCCSITLLCSLLLLGLATGCHPFSVNSSYLGTIAYQTDSSASLF